MNDVAVGKWYETARKMRFAVVGKAVDGTWILEYSTGVVSRDNGNWEGCRELVGCTSFKWVEMPLSGAWPKYYVGDKWSDEDGYVRVDNAVDPGETITADGRVIEGDATLTYSSIMRNMAAWGWRQVPEAEAKARVKPRPVPVQPLVQYPYHQVFRADQPGFVIQLEQRNADAALVITVSDIATRSRIFCLSVDHRKEQSDV